MYVYNYDENYIFTSVSYVEDAVEESKGFSLIPPEDTSAFGCYSYETGKWALVKDNDQQLKLTARKIRDLLRKGIDKFLLPASTISDQLVTEEQKTTLIQDSLTLAKWPAQEGWPYIDLPVLSDLCKSLLSIPVWEYPTQEVS